MEKQNMIYILGRISHMQASCTHGTHVAKQMFGTKFCVSVEEVN